MTDTTPGYWSTEAVNARNAARLEPRQAMAELAQAVIDTDDGFLADLFDRHAHFEMRSGSLLCTVCGEMRFSEGIGELGDWPCETLRVACHYTGIEIPEVLR